jgi:BirA family biotin operon repressor/biotin-[acetyl-CoA-carboxylase] ligase
VISFPEVDSTNDVAFDAAAQEGSDGLVVLAESQRRGRGRLGRRWVSPPRANILMSVLLHDRPARLPHEALTIAAGVAAAEGVEAACGVSCRLKWPNDLLVGGAKLAGVLVEMRRAAGGRCFVIGIGINVNAAPPRDAVDFAATSLAAASGAEVERIEVVRHVLQRLDHWVQAAASESAAVTLHEAWLPRCDMINQRLAVQCAGVRYEGRVLDVRPLEGLVLCCDSGQTICLPAERSTIIK